MSRLPFVFASCHCHAAMPVPITMPAIPIQLPKSISHLRARACASGSEPSFRAVDEHAAQLLRPSLLFQFLDLPGFLAAANALGRGDPACDPFRSFVEVKAGEIG